MIKFFRKIRQKMLTENKFSKYLLYAVGEIVLVVIGILLALQINNWNKQKLNDKLKFEIISEIKTNLQIDLKELQDDISYFDSINQYYKDIIDYLKINASPNQDFFRLASTLRLSPHFDANLSGYSLLTSKGVEIISNDSLRKSISILYETKYPYYFKYENERIQYRQLYTMPKIEHYFITIPDPKSKYFGDFKISKKDYEDLKSDTSFLNMFNIMIYENSIMIDRAKSTENDILQLMEQLTKEINTSKLLTKG